MQNCDALIDGVLSLSTAAPRLQPPPAQTSDAWHRAYDRLLAAAVRVLVDQAPN